MEPNRLLSGSRLRALFVGLRGLNVRLDWHLFFAFRWPFLGMVFAVIVFV